MSEILTAATIPDMTARQRALDVTASFIVQAPAGSGKTELLTQRFLHLLAHAVRDPEEIIAITFTRKAAAEMRARILQAIASGKNAIAREVQNKNQQLKWYLEEYPQRLRVMTIDALCLQLVQCMPSRAKLGPAMQISEHPAALYQQAVQNLLLLHQSALYQEVTQLLLHLDNNVQSVSELLVDILQNREQWLGHIVGIRTTQILEEALQRVGHELRQKVTQALPEECKSEFVYFENLAPDNVANLFLTDKGEWRKLVPAVIPKVDKKRFQDLLQSFITNTELQECLQDLANAPPSHYHEEQKKLITALVTLLPLLVAELQLVFTEHQQCDFAEVSLRALQALGEDDNPSPLALHLDYRLQHLLVDEFQDTSITHFHLLEKLLSGWQAHDGRTLFLVGDPMQSIYRFRKAEVGLFLQVQQQGINGIPLEALTLSSNFRATPELVTWINSHFKKIFPCKADISRGAITYSAASAVHAKQAEPAIHFHSTAQEASQVINILRETWQKKPQAKIALLVRARSHLPEIIAQLRQHAIPYRAIEIAALKDESLIQDLWALTRALCHPADRIAWLAILRAPWCGLLLKDLHALAADNPNATVWQLLQEGNIDKLSPDAKQRLASIIPILQWSQLKRGRLSLQELVQQTWLKLQGPALLTSTEELAIADSYFDLLSKFPFDVDIYTLLQALDQLTAPPHTDAAIQLDVMTIHKAKGLEFDVVILPGLARSTRANATKLFLWDERVTSEGTVDLLLAPIKSAAEKEDKIYRYLKLAEAKRDYFECQRLLYVAATRAKSALHLVLPEGRQKFDKQSFAGFL